MKLARQHTNDEVRSAIQGNHASQDIAVSTEPLLPRGVGQQGRARCGRRILARIEIASQHRSDTKGAKESVGDASATYGLCARRTAERKTGPLICVQRVEDSVPGFPIEVVGIGKITLWKFGGSLKNASQPRGIPKRQRLDQGRIQKRRWTHCRTYREPG